MGDFIKVVGASLGWVKDFSADIGIRYYEFLKRSAWASPIVFVAALAFFFVSESTDKAIFNTLGMLTMAGLIIFWVVASQPAIALGEQLAKIGPIRRIIQRVGTAVVLGFVITLYSLYVPAGTEGLARIAVLVVLLAGAVFLGFQLTKRAIGIKLVMLALLLALAVYLPQTTSNISAIREVVDTTIIKNIMPSANELELTLANLQGERLNAPRVFLNNGTLWWCRRTPERTAGYRCFDQSGRDQITNEELVPISQEIVREIVNRLTAEKLRLDAEQSTRDAQRAEAAEREEAERLQSIEAEKLTYIRRYVSSNGAVVDFGLSFRESNALNRSFSQRLNNALIGTANAQVFTDAALTDGVLDRLYKGDSSEAEKLRLNQVARQIVLGRLDVEFSMNNAIRGVVNATVALNARIIDTSTGTHVDAFKYHSSALGYSESEAQRKAESDLVDRVSKHINAR